MAMKKRRIRRVMVLCLSCLNDSKCEPRLIGRIKCCHCGSTMLSKYDNPGYMVTFIHA